MNDDKKFFDIFLGIDLGFTGALVAIDTDGKVFFLEDMPIKDTIVADKQRKLLDLDKIERLFFNFLQMTQGLEVLIIIEKPVYGWMVNVNSTAHMFYAFGIFEMMARRYKCDYITPIAKQWQKEFNIKGIKEDKKLGIKKVTTKDLSYLRTKELNPNLEVERKVKNSRTDKHVILDGRCDAFLLAEFGRRSLQKNG